MTNLKKKKFELACGATLTLQDIGYGVDAVIEGKPASGRFSSISEDGYTLKIFFRNEAISGLREALDWLEKEVK